MEGIRPWQINERALCEALIEDPRKSWRELELVLVSGLSREKATDVLMALEQLGAIAYYWDPPRPERLVHPLDARNPLSIRRIRLTGEGVGIIRNLLDAGRPRGVVGTFLWEGWSNAVAVWQAKRRESAWEKKSGRSC